MKPFFPKATSILSYLVRGVTWTIPNQNNEIYLTFDDGPHEEITPYVMDILDKYEIKATFFCIGQHVKANPLLYKEIIDKGHSIGNHTYTHYSGWKSNNKGYYDDIEKAARLIDSDLFRPPYGELSPIQYNYLKDEYRIVMWNILSKDYDHKCTASEVKNNVTASVKSGSIIVMHDSEKAKQNLESSLIPIIEHILEKGYIFKPIPYNKRK